MTATPPSLRPAWLDLLRAVTRLLEHDTDGGRTALLGAVDHLRAAQAARHRHDSERGQELSAAICISVADERGTDHLVGTVGDAWGLDRGAAWNSLAALEAVLEAAPNTDIVLAEPGAIESESGGVRVRSAALVQWGEGAVVIPCDDRDWPARLASALASIPAEAWGAEQGVPTAATP